MAAKSSVYSFSREMLKTGDRPAFFEELFGESDRACAILCGGIIDQALVIALQTKMRALTKADSDALFFKQTSLLGTTAARIDLARALDLITKDERKLLDKIKRIRNTFAHTVRPATFKNPLIVKECEKLPPYKAPDMPQLDAMNNHRRRCIQCSALSAAQLTKISQSHFRYNEIRAVVEV